jgi:hypothetical protein
MGFLPRFLEFGVRGLTHVAYTLGPCPRFSVEKYHFPVDSSQKCSRMQHHLYKHKVLIGHFTVGTIFHDNDTEMQNWKQTVAEGRTERN